MPPYNKGAFKIEINFPAEYPFKPPKITFKTKIYHPNIDEKGQMCLPIISPERWKPATKADQGWCIYNYQQIDMIDTGQLVKWLRIRCWSGRSDVQISGGSNQTQCCQRLAAAATFL